MKALCILPLLLAFASSSALAHDPLEITATAYLRTNHLELRVVMIRKIIQRAAVSQGVHLLDFSIPSERAEAMPVLRALAGGLFALTCGTNVLHATNSSAKIAAEDHVEFTSLYPTAAATNGPLRLDAKVLGFLPADDSYAVNLIVLDMVNNKVLEQKLLNAKNGAIEFALPAREAPESKRQAPEKGQASNVKPRPPDRGSLALNRIYTAGQASRLSLTSRRFSLGPAWMPLNSTDNAAFGFFRRWRQARRLSYAVPSAVHLNSTASFQPGTSLEFGTWNLELFS